MDGRGVVLASGVFANDPMALSPSRATASYGSTHMVVQTLARLRRGGWDSIALDAVAPGTDGAGNGPTTRASKAPSTWKSSAGSVRSSQGGSATDFAGTSDGVGTVQHWRIAIRRDRGLAGRPGPFDMDGFDWLESTRDTSMQTHSCTSVTGGHWLFFEDFTYADRRGVLAAAEVGPDGAIGAPTLVIAGPGHLSYLYVFDHDGTTYLIPNSGAAGIVQLYKATAFPESWSRLPCCMEEIGRRHLRRPT